MSFEELLRIVWRRKWMVVAIVVIATVATYFVGRSLPEVYSAEASLVVTIPGRSASDFEATESAQVLARTYAELIQSENVAGRVADRLPGTQTAEGVLRDTAFEPIQDTRLLVVTAEAGSAIGAANLANTYAFEFESYTTQDLAEAIVGSVSLADRAIPPDSPVRPRPGLYAAVMLLLSMFAGAGLAVLRDRMEKRLGGERAVGEALELPVLARVPMASIRRGTPLDPSNDTPFLEAFRVLWANIEFLGEARPASVVVTSPSAGEGKSVSAASLARVAAELGHSVILIEGDLRRPRLSRPTRARKGLPEVLAGEVSVRAALQPTGHPNLEIIAAGTPQDNPAHLLGSHALDELIAQASDASDLVVIDSPPVSVGPDALRLAHAAAACLVVVSNRRTDPDRAVAAVHQLRRAGARLLGVILNEVQAESSYYADSAGRSFRKRSAAPAPGLTPSNSE